MLGLFTDYAGSDNPAERRRRLGYGDILIGLLGQSLGATAVLTSWFTDRSVTTAFVLGMLVLVLGTAVLAVGCVRHVRYKQYPTIVAVIGLLSLPGVFALCCLPNLRYRKRRRQGFDVVMARKVSTTWVVDPDDPDVPESVRRFRRPYTAENRA